MRQLDSITRYLQKMKAPEFKTNYFEIEKYMQKPEIQPLWDLGLKDADRIPHLSPVIRAVYPLLASASGSTQVTPQDRRKHPWLFPSSSNPSASLHL